MITAYHRPNALEEALKLLSVPDTVPLGGGTLLSKPTADAIQAVDLQRLGLNTLVKSGNILHIGATVTLQTLLESEHCSDALKRALRLEAPLNVRNAATIAGTIVACDGRSPFVTALLAMDAKLEIVGASADKTETLPLGDVLPLREQLRGKLITKVSAPLNANLAFDYLARTPSDSPIVCVALAGRSVGRTRMAVGGFGKCPILAVDGNASDDLAAAARNAFHEATDEWASAEYRMDVAAILALRCKTQITATRE
ncbi:MAG: oxidoreductase [Anaerolineaceae bacterium]|nr:MAG: oxidoreductase [Anaerolineaceae bacterium]